MQVAPCGHQALCRLCFVHNIQEAVAARDLPLKCLMCGSKIIRVKNNTKSGHGTDHPVHVGLGSRMKKMPKSVSGYSLCATTDTDGPEINAHQSQKNYGGRHPSLAQSHSSYSMSSGEWYWFQKVFSSNWKISAITFCVKFFEIQVLHASKLVLWSWDWSSVVGGREDFTTKSSKTDVLKNVLYSRLGD